MLSECKAGANSSCSRVVVIQMLDLWATGRALNHGHCTKQRGCKWALVLHRDVQSNWSVIDRALLFDPWRLPKRKANRAFPFSHTLAGRMGARVPAWDSDNRPALHVCIPVLTIHMLCMHLYKCMWLCVHVCLRWIGCHRKKAHEYTQSGFNALYNF